MSPKFAAIIVKGHVPPAAKSPIAVPCSVGVAVCPVAELKVGCKGMVLSQGTEMFQSKVVRAPTLSGYTVVELSGMKALSVIVDPYGMKTEAPVGVVPVVPNVVRGMPDDETRTPLDAFTTDGDRLPPKVYGLTSDCHRSDEFH
jgi:hypothetical protein